MNKKALRVLEYDKIAELLREETGCGMSARMAEGISPGGDIRDITMELRSTTEAVDLIIHKGPLPTEGLHDLKQVAGLARKGSSLTTKQLLMVAFDLRIASRIVTFLKGEIPDIPSITGLADLLMPNETLSKEIERCILTEDEIADDASPELKRIRRAIVKKNEDIKARLSSIVSKRNNNSFLQDSIVTIRDGRYVIPVKQEYRQEFPGIVHDQSKGGATLFIEPQAVVDMNNELRELSLAEEAEVARILSDLSGRVGVIEHDIESNQDIISKLDFIMAKGKLSQKMKGEEPKLTEDMALSLKEGRHPLIEGDKVVPINVSLGRDLESDAYDTLVVTGPNTGGKTVTLKTVGLLTLMALSGLHIPASCESRIPVYSDVFADIGDEQSIEQSLSTFSSHMKNIVYIAGVADRSSLVLLDELGAGTDPTEGAALAVAVLERLREKGASTIATTHYNELKKYALSTEGVENASMEFDVETLSPTYRLITGVAGKSNAFEISKKLGLSKKIIERAESLIEQGDLAFQDVLSAIEEDRQRALRDREEAEKIRREAEEAREDIKTQKEKLEKNREKLLRDAREEARDVIRDAMDTADEVKRELNALSKEGSLGERNRLFSESKHKLNEKSEEYSEKIVKTVNEKPVKASDLREGDPVKYLPFDQNGEIIELPDQKGNLLIQLGTARMKVKLSDITLLDKVKKKQTKSRARVSDYLRNKAMNIKREIDVRGEILEDALIRVEKYLDDAAMAGLEEAVIIHGKGEGILKEGIRRELKRNRHVKSIRTGEFNEGGEGVTVVVLK